MRANHAAVVVGFGGSNQNLTQAHQRILKVTECEAIYEPKSSRIVKDYRAKETPFGFDNLVCALDLVSFI